MRVVHRLAPSAALAATILALSTAAYGQGYGPPQPQPYSPPYYGPPPGAQPYPPPPGQYPPPGGYPPPGQYPPQQPPYYGPPPGPPPPAGPPKEKWSDFKIGDGVCPYVGVVALPGFGVQGAANGWTDIEPAVLVAAKLGLLFDRTELAVEVSPVSWWVLQGKMAVFQANLTIGSLMRLTDRLYFPMRGGMGVAAVNLPTANLVVRADVLGLGYNYGHLLIEATFPSIRHMTDFRTHAAFDFLFGLSCSYAF